jgi:hypothetical protein
LMPSFAQWNRSDPWKIAIGASAQRNSSLPMTKCQTQRNYELVDLATDGRATHSKLVQWNSIMTFSMDFHRLFRDFWLVIIDSKIGTILMLSWFNVSHCDACQWNRFMHVKVPTKILR